MLSDFDYKRTVQALEHAERNASQSEKSNWRSVLRNFEMEYSTTAEPTEKLLDDDFKPLTLDELIVKVRKSMDSTQKQRKDFIAEGDKSMADYAEGWLHALTFVLANADQKWWNETEKLNR